MIAHQQARNRIDQEAADWFVRLDDTTQPRSAREQARWIAWLQRSPRHLEAFFTVVELYDRLEGLDRDHRFDVEAWLERRRRRPTLIGTRDPIEMQKQPARAAEALRRPLALVAAIMGLGLALTLVSWTLFSPESYRTQLGEQRTLRLDDGSIMQMNTVSHARVSLDEHARVVELEGEAMFNVAHDAGRPFLVKTRDATIQAIGTKFNVYQQEGRTRVAVIEGAVVISPAGTQRALLERIPSPPAKMPDAYWQSLSLRAGEEAQASGGHIEKHDSADITAAIAWQQHRLVFQNTELAEIARQFNRYNEEQIHVAPPIGRLIRLSGTFDARHPQTLLRYLSNRHDVVIRHDGTIHGVEATVAH